MDINGLSILVEQATRMNPITSATAFIATIFRVRRGFFGEDVDNAQTATFNPHYSNVKTAVTVNYAPQRP